MGRAILAMPRGVVVVAGLVVGGVVWFGDLGGTPPAGSCSEDAILAVFFGAVIPSARVGV